MWDNERIFDYYETEQERMDRLYRRLEIEEEKEDFINERVTNTSKSISRDHHD